MKYFFYTIQNTNIELPMHFYVIFDKRDFYFTFWFNNSVDSEFPARVKLGIIPLAQRRKCLDVNFAYDFSNNYIEDSDLLGAVLTLNVPTFNSRNYVSFFTSHHTKNYSYQ